MSEGDYQIALDADVGERLERLAAARGVSARDLVTAMIGDAPTEADDAAALAELEAIWAKVELGSEQTVPHHDVREWFSTWGTDEFKPWSSKR